MICELCLKAIFFHIVHGETEVLPTFSFGSYRITDLEGCLENFTSALLSLCLGKRKPRERTDSFRDLELPSKLGPESDFLFSILRFFLYHTLKQVSCIKTAWIFFIGAGVLLFEMTQLAVKNWTSCNFPFIPSPYPTLMAGIRGFPVKPSSLNLIRIWLCFLSFVIEEWLYILMV